MRLRDQLIEQQIPGVSSFNCAQLSTFNCAQAEAASSPEKSVSHDRSAQISHGPKLHTLAYYLTAGPAKDDLAKTLTIRLARTSFMATFSNIKADFSHISSLQEVDEEKVEDPLTGLSGNSSDLSDSEKSSSMQDLKMKWAGDLTRSLSARRQRSGSR